MATLGAGVTLSYDNAGSPVLLAEIIDANPPIEQVAKVDVSNHDNTDKKKRYIAGWISQTDPTFTIMYAKTLYNTIQGFIDARTSKDWTLTFPDGSTEEFTGFLMENGIASPLEDKMTQNISICITDSNVDFTPAA